jgi:hypothetical protein
VGLLAQTEYVQLLLKIKGKKARAAGDINGGGLLPEQRTNKQSLRSVMTEILDNIENVRGERLTYCESHRKPIIVGKRE